MSRYCFDVEANGLLDTVDTIHTLVIVDIDDGSSWEYADQQGYAPISEGLKRLKAATALYAHNLLRYDLPALEKVLGWRPSESTELFDTLVMARLRFAHIAEQDHANARRGKYPSHLIGSQGIEAWGYRLGEKKIDYTAWCESQGIEDPWALWTPQMTSYCRQDVLSNVSLIDYLRDMGIPKPALALEMKLAKILAQQEINGWPVNRENMSDLVSVLSARKAELEVFLINHFGSWQVPKDTDADGNHVPFIPKVNNAKLGYEKGVPVLRYNVVKFNPNSRHHIADRLKVMYGWKPEEFTPSGLPALDETILKGLDIPIADELGEYLVVSKHLGMISEGKHAWAKYLTPNEATGMDHIHHSIGPTAVTHRHRHSHPNLGQVPAHGTYGKQCRSVFTVPKGYVAMGSDASGLELRCLAHYMAKYDDGAYGNIILEGDIHTTNQEAAGLETRDQAKTFIYAYLYGAGDAKLGSIVNTTVSEETQRKYGRALRSQFETKIPALGYLTADVKAAAQARGWLRLPDQRRVYIRHAHAALNSLLQGAGAIICKQWQVNAHDLFVQAYNQDLGGRWGDPVVQMGWIHDEIQLAVAPGEADLVSSNLRQAMERVTEQFNWRIPLKSEVQVGETWADTH